MEVFAFITGIVAGALLCLSWCWVDEQMHDKGDGE